MVSTWSSAVCPERDAVAPLLGGHLQRRLAPGFAGPLLDVAARLGDRPVSDGEAHSQLSAGTNDESLVVVALRSPEVMVDVQGVKEGRAAGATGETGKNVQKSERVLAAGHHHQRARSRRKEAFPSGQTARLASQRSLSPRCPSPRSRPRSSLLPSSVRQGWYCTTLRPVDPAELTGGAL